MCHIIFISVFLFFIVIYRSYFFNLFRIIIFYIIVPKFCPFESKIENFLIIRILINYSVDLNFFFLYCLDRMVANFDCSYQISCYRIEIDSLSFLYENSVQSVEFIFKKKTIIIQLLLYTIILEFCFNC